MNLFYSHPNKKISKHVEGIINKSFGDVDDWTKNLIIKHDWGKINRNFQNKILNNDKFSGYNHHSYLSAILNTLWSIYYHKYNGTITNKDIQSEIILINLSISGHHTTLKNIDKIYLDGELESLRDYIIGNKELIIDFKQFLIENNYSQDIINTLPDMIDDNTFDLCIEFINTNTNYIIENTDQLSNYFNIRNSSATLNDGDRRDASDYSIRLRHEDRLKYNYSLLNGYERLMNIFMSGEQTPLNLMRNEIREYAVDSLIKNLKNNDHRVFSLSAPTGSGKTLMLIKLALTILEHKGFDKYDILFSLPFLTITDQITSIVNNDLNVSPLNYTSNAEVSDSINKLLETNSDTEIKKLLYSENSLDHSFVITSFVQLFELFTTNKVSRLNKLINLKNRIIIIDEYQSLPPNLYYFFMGLLTEFCNKYDSYVIISTATMPNFDMDYDNFNNTKIKKIFKNKIKNPIELSHSKFFNHEVFNRYNITYNGKMDADRLIDFIKSNYNNSDDSVLCVLNTINTSTNIYTRMVNVNTNFEKIYLLNTKQTIVDRKRKLNQIIDDLKNNKKILVISTQLIEAGVDLDFNIVCTDIAPIPNIIQRSGRCNRNGKLNPKKGRVDVFVYQDDYIENNDNNCDSDYVYGTAELTKKFKTDVINYRINETFSEIDFHIKQNQYSWYQSTRNNLGKIKRENKSDLDLYKCISDGKYNDLGEFQLIPEDESKITIFVGDPQLWDEFEIKYNNLQFKSNQQSKIEFDKLKRKVFSCCVDVRMSHLNQAIPPEFEMTTDVDGKPKHKTIMGIHKLINHTERYDSETGLN